MKKPGSPELRLESVQIVLPEELPFEKGTGLSRQDACSRLMFQLLVEKVIPGIPGGVGKKNRPVS